MARLVWKEVGETTSPEQKESMLGYAARNIAKAPFVAASGIAGLPGDIMESLRQDKALPSRKETAKEKERYEAQPFFQRILGELGGQRIGEAARPGTQFLQALPTSQELRGSLPEYLGGSRPGDEPAEMAASVAPLLLSGGLSLPGLISGASRTAGALGLGYAGKLGGRILGEEIGLPSTGESLGGLAGGALGVHTGGKMGGLLRNYPTQVLPKMIEKEASRIREAPVKKEAGLEAYRTKKYAVAEKALEKLPGKNIEINAGSLKKDLMNISSKTAVGVEGAEQRRIEAMLGGISDKLQDGKLSIKDAINIKQNLNSSLYDRTLPPVLKRSMREARNALVGLIDKEAKKSPEFGNAWKKAESATRQLKATQAAETPEASKEAKHLEKAADKIDQALKYSTRVAAGYTTNLVSGLLGVAGWPKALLSLGGYQGAKQWQAVRSVMKENPKVYAQWKSAVKKASAGKPSDFIALLPEVDALVAKSEPKKERRLIWKEMEAVSQ